MDLERTDEQRMLADAVAEICARPDTAPAERRAAARTDPGYRTGVWADLAAAGVTGLLVAEADGGSGAGPGEAAAVAEQLGRSGAGEPWIESAVVAAAVVTDLADATARTQILGPLAAGTGLPILADTEPGAGPGDRPQTRARRTANGWTVTGRKNPVVYGAAATVLLVPAVIEDGAVVVLAVDPAAPGVSVTGYRTFDDRRAAQIDLADAPAAVLGDAGRDAAAAVAAAVIRGRACWAAEAVGAMATALDLTVDYLRTRRQFGSPLAAFQALTHRAADMYVALELARSMSSYATATLTAGTVSAEVAAQSALQVCRSARLIAQEAIQLHGGIGMTAEHPLSGPATRLPAIEAQLGGADDALHRLMDDAGQVTGAEPADR